MNHKVFGIQWEGLVKKNYKLRKLKQCGTGETTSQSMGKIKTSAHVCIRI